MAFTNIGDFALLGDIEDIFSISTQTLYFKQEGKIQDQNDSNIDPDSPVQSVERTKSALFDKTQTLALIAMYSDRIDKFESPKYRNKNLWEEITCELNDLCRTGFTSQQVEGRWETLLSGYRKFKSNQNETGKGKRSFEYENELSDVLGSRHDITPAAIIGSLQHHANATSESNPDEEEQSSSATGSQREHDSGENAKGIKRKRRSNSSEVINILKNFTEKEEKKSEERMKCVQKMHDEKMSVFNSLIDVMKNNTK